MDQAGGDKDPFELPKLTAWFTLDTRRDRSEARPESTPATDFYDIKFCPYQTTEVPVFAIISKNHILIYKVPSQCEDENYPWDLQRIIYDKGGNVSNCSCTWALDYHTDSLYLCVAGSDAKVKVIDVLNSKIVRAMEKWVLRSNPRLGTSEQELTIPHQEINDLKTSPVNASIVASASSDTTIRIWGLDPAHKNQPCLCILGGQSHLAGILSMDFHVTGRYLISAGYDQIINLWTLPDLPDEPVESPLAMHYSHFSSSEIHSGIIDCVSFYGDLILSRACHNDSIELWKIEGFSSGQPPPLLSTAPTTYDPSRRTRSGFVPFTPPPTMPLYQRLVKFHAPGCENMFFMRFQLYSAPGKHPVLAFGNHTGRIFFWDLERLPIYQQYVDAVRKAEKDAARNCDDDTTYAPNNNATYTTDGDEARTPETDAAASVPMPSWLNTVQRRAKGPRRRRPLDRLEGEDRLGGLRIAFNEATRMTWEKKYNVEVPYSAVEAHRMELLNVDTFVVRQVAWSPGGEWCIIVGSSDLAVILRRWSEKSRVPEVSKTTKVNA